MIALLLVGLLSLDLESAAHAGQSASIRSYASLLPAGRSADCSQSLLPAGLLSLESAASRSASVLNLESAARAAAGQSASRVCRARAGWSSQASR